MIRRRLRTKCASVRVVMSVCALSSFLSFYIAWVHIVFNAQVGDCALTEYLRELNARQLLCNTVSPRNVSKLFFKTCDINTDRLYRQPYRLAVNFTCSQIAGKVMKAQSEKKEATHQSRKTLSLEETNTNSTCKEPFIVSSGSPVFTVSFRDPCLKQFIADKCYDEHKVPRVVHYVWFSRHRLDVVTLLSVLSAYRFLDPCLILFHADSVPEGPYWRVLLSLVPVVMLVQRTAPSVVFGRTLGVVQHKSDIARLEALKEYGGIYLDGDQIVVRSLDEFRDKEFVMGHENARNLANSLLISVPNAKFIDVWYKNYRSYNPKQWGIHSTFLPLALARIYPKMIHNAEYAFIKPDLTGIRKIWEGHYDWSENHAVHLYYRSMVEGKEIRTDYTLEELTKLNSSLGEIARHIVFGSKDSCHTITGRVGETHVITQRNLSLL